MNYYYRKAVKYDAVHKGNGGIRTSERSLTDALDNTLSILLLGERFLCNLVGEGESVRTFLLLNELPRED